MLVFKVKSYGKYPKHENWWKWSWYSSDVLMDKLVLPFSRNQGTFETVKGWKNHCSGTIYRAFPFFLKISNPPPSFLKEMYMKTWFQSNHPSASSRNFCVVHRVHLKPSTERLKTVAGSKQLWNFNQQYNFFSEATSSCIYRRVILIFCRQCIATFLL